VRECGWYSISSVYGIIMGFCEHCDETRLHQGIIVVVVVVVVIIIIIVVVVVVVFKYLILRV
jgi:hypothetical protein